MASALQIREFNLFYFNWIFLFDVNLFSNTEPHDFIKFFALKD